MYFIAGKADGHIEEKNGNKYLVFDSTDKNKEALKKYTELWDGIKNLIETIDNKLSEYGKAFTKIKFNSADNLLLSRALKLYNLTVVVKSVFKDGKYYPQVFLEEIFLYKLQKFYRMKELMFQKESRLINQTNQKNYTLLLLVY